MKEKLHYGIEAALAIAVIILFVFQFSGNKKSSVDYTTPTENNTTSERAISMAYIDVDSLLMNYTYSIEIYEQVAKKAEDLRADINTRVRKLQNEVNDFQRKIDTQAFLTMDRAQQEEQRLMRAQEDLNNYQAEKSQELNEEQMRLNQDLSKTIIIQLRDYNKDKGYHIIHGKMNDNILYADEAFNITAEVIEYLNKRRVSNP